MTDPIEELTRLEADAYRRAVLREWATANLVLDAIEAEARSLVEAELAEIDAVQARPAPLTPLDRVRRDLAARKARV